MSPDRVGYFVLPCAAVLVAFILFSGVVWLFNYLMDQV